MQKEDLIAQIISIIEAELKAASSAALESAEEATDEESRPENKYDTHALETSYVASAQAHYAKDLKDALQAYHNLVELAGPSGPIGVGSIVTTLGPSGRDLFFIGPAQGGIELPTDAGTLTVLTPKSPLGRQLLGKSLGDSAGDRKILRVE